jgi:hypothetical protein
MNNINEAIAQALNPITTQDMIAFMGTMWNESEETTMTATRYFRNLAESKDPAASRYIQDFVLSQKA